MGSKKHNVVVKEMKSFTLVDNQEQLNLFLREVKKICCVGGASALYLDLKGNNVSRYGSISVIQVLIMPTMNTCKIYLLDIDALGSSVFTTSIGKDDGTTFGKILADKLTIKTLFDVRKANDALHHLHGVKLEGVSDLQLTGLASCGGGVCVTTLAKSLEADLTLPVKVQSYWRETQKKGLRATNSMLGGSPSLWKDRPLHSDLAHYCAAEIHLLPILSATYNTQILSTLWKKRVRLQTQARLALVNLPNYKTGEFRRMNMPDNWHAPLKIKTSNKIASVVPRALPAPLTNSASLVRLAVLLKMLRQL